MFILDLSQPSRIFGNCEKSHISERRCKLKRHGTTHWQCLCVGFIRASSLWHVEAPLIFIVWGFFCFGLFCFNVYLFLRQRETEHERGRGRERGRHRIGSRLQALSRQHRAQRGARTHRLRDRDLSWSRTLNQLSHPGAPRPWFLRGCDLQCARAVSFQHVPGQPLTFRQRKDLCQPQSSLLGPRWKARQGITVTDSR